MIEEELDQEEYRLALQRAWEGSRSPDEPDRPPAKFAMGFMAGLILGTQCDNIPEYREAFLEEFLKAIRKRVERNTVGALSP